MNLETLKQKIRALSAEEFIDLRNFLANYEKEIQQRNFEKPHEQMPNETSVFPLKSE